MPFDAEMIKRLLLFPYNGCAKESVAVIDAINKIEERWEIEGFIDDDISKKESLFGKYKVLGGRDVLERKMKECFILAVPGNSYNYLERKRIINSLNIPDNRFATIIHPSAVIGVEVDIGNNSLIMANVVLTANVKCGSSVIILPNTVISHDSVIGDYSFIGSNVSVSGYVVVGENCFIGTGSRFIQKIKIGNRSMIGLGSTVIRDVDADSVAYGNPARVANKIM